VLKGREGARAGFQVPNRRSALHTGGGQPAGSRGVRYLSERASEAKPRCGVSPDPAARHMWLMELDNCWSMHINSEEHNLVNPPPPKRDSPSTAAQQYSNYMSGHV
jgi:hypothetical protein